MCIYCGTDKYRKIYSEHYGKIPKEDNGRSYEIHHLDGNRLNNSPSNLIALSIQDHYDLHKLQEDWGACIRIASKMKLSSELLSELATKSNNNRVMNGTHPWLGSGPAKKWTAQRLQNKTHNFLGKTNPRYDSTIYKFQHKSGIIIETTQRELIESYSLDHSHVSRLTKGLRKSHKGWKIIL